MSLTSEVLLRLTHAGLVTPQTTCWLTLRGTKSSFPSLFPSGSLHPELTLCLCVFAMSTFPKLVVSTFCLFVLHWVLSNSSVSCYRRLHIVSGQRSSINLSPRKLKFVFVQLKEKPSWFKQYALLESIQSFLASMLRVPELLTQTSNQSMAARRAC